MSDKKDIIVVIGFFYYLGTIIASIVWLFIDLAIGIVFLLFSLICFFYIISFHRKSIVFNNDEKSWWFISWIPWILSYVIICNIVEVEEDWIVILKIWLTLSYIYYIIPILIFKYKPKDKGLKSKKFILSLMNLAFLLIWGYQIQITSFFSGVFFSYTAGWLIAEYTAKKHFNILNKIFNILAFLFLLFLGFGYILTIFESSLLLKTFSGISVFYFPIWFGWVMGNMMKKRLGIGLYMIKKIMNMSHTNLAKRNLKNLEKYKDILNNEVLDLKYNYSKSNSEKLLRKAKELESIMNEKRINQFLENSDSKRIAELIKPTILSYLEENQINLDHSEGLTLSIEEILFQSPEVLNIMKRDYEIDINSPKMDLEDRKITQSKKISAKGNKKPLECKLRERFRKETGKHVFWPPDSRNLTKQYKEWKEERIKDFSNS